MSKSRRSAHCSESAGQGATERAAGDLLYPPPYRSTRDCPADRAPGPNIRMPGLREAADPPRCAGTHNAGRIFDAGVGASQATGVSVSVLDARPRGGLIMPTPHTTHSSRPWWPRPTKQNRAERERGFDDLRLCCRPPLPNQHDGWFACWIIGLGFHDYLPLL
jgi:hypothetical protein